MSTIKRFRVKHEKVHVFLDSSRLLNLIADEVRSQAGENNADIPLQVEINKTEIGYEAIGILSYEVLKEQG